MMAMLKCLNFEKAALEYLKGFEEQQLHTGGMSSGEKIFRSGGNESI